MLFGGVHITPERNTTMAVTRVTSYHILVYGGPTGYQTNRAQIQVSGANGPAAWLRFNDPGMSFEQDYEQGGIIRMHLPTTMFKPIVDLLRNEDPVTVSLRQGRGFLEVGSEPIGEGE